MCQRHHPETVVPWPLECGNLVSGLSRSLRWAWPLRAWWRYPKGPGEPFGPPLIAVGCSLWTRKVYGSALPRRWLFRTCHPRLSGGSRAPGV